MKNFILILTVLLAGIAHAGDGEAIEAMKAKGMTGTQIHAVCAAANAIVAVKQDGIFSDVLFAESRRHKQLAGADASFIEPIMKSLQDGYNNRTLEWVGIVDLAADCQAL